MPRPVLERMCPFFIAGDVRRSITFYRDILGFETWYQEPDEEPFFAVIGRDGAQLFLKAGEAAPMPNPRRDPAMRWDAYVLVFDPDSIATEFADRGVTFSVPLMDTHDALRGFEIKDPDGYTLFFGCPRDEALFHKNAVADLIAVPRKRGTRRSRRAGQGPLTRLEPAFTAPKCELPPLPHCRPSHRFEGVVRTDELLVISYFADR